MARPVNASLHYYYVKVNRTRDDDYASSSFIAPIKRNTDESIIFERRYTRRSMERINNFKDKKINLKLIKNYNNWDNLRS